MYVMVETMRIDDDNDSEELKNARDLFRMELSKRNISIQHIFLVHPFRSLQLMFLFLQHTQ